MHTITTASVRCPVSHSASQLFAGVSPPEVHIHCDFVPLSTDQQPLTSPLASCPPLISALQPDDEMNAADRQAFEDWLINRWSKKDRMIARYYRDGDLVHGEKHARSQNRRSSDVFLELSLKPPSALHEAKRFLLVPLACLLAYGYYRLGRFLFCSLRT